MRTFTVDTKGLLVVLKGVLVLAVLVGAWAVRGPLVSLVRHDVNKDALVARASNTFNATTTPAYALPEPGALNGNYLFVDADAMRVTMFRGADEVGSVPIEHVPDTASPDALVSGSYPVDAVKSVEVSTITMVRYPHYVQFGDHYALHGEPSDTQFNALPQDYPGNSVLLSFDDAEKVSEFVTTGMMVYVKAPVPSTPGASTTTIHDTNETPATTASAYALRDLKNGQVYLVKGGAERYPIASITKLVTAAVASEVVGHGTEILAPNGEHYTLGDLFYPLLLRSDNSVAERIASYAGTNEFIAHMNAYVHALGMRDSTFADSSGLSPKNVSSANDLLLFAQHLYDKDQYLLAMTGEDSVTITSTEGNDRLVVNQNKLADDPHFRGGKLGYTDEAGQTSLAVFDVPLGKETRPVAVVVLGSKDWKQDTRTLVRWLVNAAAK